jgi:tRNA threonylcarbamoyladenosine biosynthesis protein TsaB
VRLLAIETATDSVGVALLRTDGGAAERVHHGGRAHAELLAPAIEEVCAVSGCAVADIDEIAVDVGPGLFTGLRVGVATAKALAQALGIAVLGVSSLDVLAEAASERVPPGRREPVVAVVDARRGEVFAASYRFDGEDRAPGHDGPTDPAWVRDDRAEPISPEALVDWLDALTSVCGRVRVVGDGATRYRPLLAALAPVDLGWAADLSAPPPLALARLARRRLARGVPPLAPADLVPDYRRPADARINWEQRAPRVPGPDPTPAGPR